MEHAWTLKTCRKTNFGVCSQALVTMGCNTVEVRAEPWCLFEVYPEKNVVDFLGIRKENMLKELENSDLPRESRKMQSWFT